MQNIFKCQFKMLHFTNWSCNIQKYYWNLNTSRGSNGLESSSIMMVDYSIVQEQLFWSVIRSQKYAFVNRHTNVNRITRKPVISGHKMTEWKLIEDRLMEFMAPLKHIPLQHTKDSLLWQFINIFNSLKLFYYY